LRTEEAAQRRWTRCPGSRQAWKVLRELDEPATAQPLDALVHPETGELCTDTADKLQALSSHFQSLLQPAAARSEAERAQRERSEATVAALRKESVGHVDGLDSEFTDEEVRDALRCMKNHKAPGQDDMQAELALLKYGGQAGVQMICAVFNGVRHTEWMPAGWRDGVMVPLPKTGDLTDCGNYRGLTLMPAIDKLFSQIMVKRLAAHVPLHDHQYGFRTGRSTFDALFALHAAVDPEPRVRNGLLSCLLFLDWSKAYDRVMHAACLDRLAAKGVTGKARRLVDAMYKNASSRVRLEGPMFSAFHVTCGVAQGCPLSPFLFAVFVDSMLEMLQTRCAADGLPVGADSLAGQAYADDSIGDATTPPGLQQVINVAKEFGD
jgi:Reverse transcriptase (RNA-dependent DNA polymerase)